MRHRFTHEFEDVPPLGDFGIDMGLPQGATIRFNVDKGDIWVSANRAGWLHLARICAEMGLHSGFNPGYHFHRSHDWQDSPGIGNEVSFELAEDPAPPSVGVAKA